MDRDHSLEVAHRIGRRIVRRASWRGEACTWEVAVLDAATGGNRFEAAAGGVYQGTAGIALFLGELHRATGDAEVGRTAAGALRHALDFAAALPPANLAFHGGRVGVAWVAARLADRLGRPELRDAAAALLAPVAGHEGEDSAFDVVGGAAGAIPALLGLGPDLDLPELLPMAVRLGDRLIEGALREPGGWSWRTVGRTATRNLAGLAHGASGIGLALLELARSTGAGRFRFAAEMAFLYERGLFDAERSNWPDLRHRELSELIHSADPDAVRRAAAEDSIPAYRPQFVTAWCHGAAGIGLARVRAFALTGRRTYRREAEAAVATTVAGLRPPVRNNYSLCHGASGNAELVLVAARVFADPALRAIGEECAEYGWEIYERAGAPWPCGTVDPVSDPSLMLGEAGIGHFYLRLAGEDVAPVLWHEPPLAAGADGVEDGGFQELAERWVDDAFGSTRRAFAALGVAPPAVAVGGPEPLASTPVAAAYDELRRRVGGERGGRRELLADAFRVERERHELAATPVDLVAAYLRRLRRSPVEQVDWRRARFGLGAEVRPVTTRRDWGRWLARREGGDGADAGSPEDGATWLIARQEDRLVARPVGPLTACVVRALASPVPLAELVDRVAAAIDGGGGVDRTVLADRVAGQLRELYRVGFVEVLADAAKA
jgi:hypothetical protein